MPDQSTLLLAALLAVLPLMGGAVSAGEPVVDLRGEAARVIQDYATTLQAALKGEMAKSGPVAAISFCHDQAPQIAANISQRSGWTVGRTSGKLRNAASAPDAYESKAMAEFAARIAKGEAVADVTKAEVVETKGGQVFRFVKAIPTGEICLTCHGAAVKPEMKAKLDALYPGDQATGFKAGDMRGIFTLSKRL